MRSCILIVALSFVSCMTDADTHISPQIYKYYITTNDLLDNLIARENNLKFNRQDAFDFMHSSTDNNPKINKALTLDTKTTNIGLERENKTIVTSKFYTEEAMLRKKILDGKLELYGGVVLGASYYRPNGLDDNLNYTDKIAILAGSETGAKYKVSDNFGLVVEGQYNLTGEMAGNSEVIKNFRDTQYNGSKVLKTGVEWNF